VNPPKKISSGSDVLASNDGWSYRDRIGPEGAGQSIGAFYVHRYRHSDAACWHQRLAEDEIELNGVGVKDADRILVVGDVLIWHRPPWVEPDVPEHVDIIHDDGDLLVVNKPSGLPVMPAGGFLEHTLLRMLEKRWPTDPPRPVHRLGRGTSGLLMCARQTDSRAWLSRALRDHGSIEKIYRCRTVPADLKEEGCIEVPIGKQAHPLLGRMWCADPGGLPSRSDYRVLQRDSDSTLLEVQIRTGRPHQIRIHLAAIGAPLVGDPLFAAGGGLRDLAALPGDLGYQLHAYQLNLYKPGGERVCFEAPLPPALR
jgi:23S rRNA pseudouridine1911/1915/1917 synthase